MDYGMGGVAPAPVVGVAPAPVVGVAPGHLPRLAS